MDSVYYGDLLDSSEILKIGLILSEFKHGVITYLEFKDKMRELGYELDVELIDSSRLKLLKSVNEFQERVSNNTIIAKDINSFFGIDKNGVKFKFSYDRRMVDVLAENGNVEAMGILESLKRLERKLCRGAKVVSKIKK